jgi:protein O-mannosyl-transferase
MVVAGALTYANSLSGPFVNDDRGAIVNNQQIRRLWPPSTVLFPARELSVSGRPLVNLSFALNYAMGGLDVRGYHVANITIHLLCALLLFGIIRRTLNLPILQGRFARHSLDLAFACAVIWMLHPLQTEAVDYLTERTESMMAFFYLLTLYAGIRARFSARAGWWFGASIVSCALGMACKESMVTAPLAVMLYDWTFGVEPFRKRWPLYLGLAASWLELAALVSTGPRIHSAGFTTEIRPWTYLLNQTIMIVRYLRLAVWPRSLVLDYGVPRPLTLGAVVPYALVVAVLLAGTIAALVWRRTAGFLGAWFFLTLAPTSSLVPIATEVGAERRMYLPLASLIVLAVVVVFLAWERLIPQSSAANRRLLARVGFMGGIVPLAILAIVLASGTIQRNREYASAVTLARTVVERRPHGRAHLTLATELLAAGRHDEAMAQFRAAVLDYPKARYSLGVELFNDGKLDEAIEQLQEFVHDEPALLEVIPAREAIGRALETKGRLEQAAEVYRTILRMTPSYAQARARLADVLLAQQKFDEAIVQYQEFLQARPATVTVATNLGVALAGRGRMDEAIASFRRAVDIEPQNPNAHRNLANALLEVRDFDGAELHAEHAVSLSPGDPVAHNILGLALAAQRKFDRAILQFQESLLNDSHYLEARDNLALVQRMKDSRYP